jgi:hypothetical protein
MIRAANMVVGIGSSSSHAGHGDGYPVTTVFTSVPGEQPSLGAAAPGRVAIVSPSAALARGYLTTTRRATWLFPPAQDGDEH